MDAAAQRLAIVADDLTGAADAAAPFAARGVRTAIHLSGPPPSADVVACSTESRDLAEERAVCGTRQAVAALLATGESAPRWLFKKIDSAMRGHPAAELRAVMAATGSARAVVVAALPAQGRTTVGGRQFAHGLALGACGFEGVEDDLAVVFGGRHEIRLLDLAVVRSGPAELAAAMAACGDRVILADSETDADIRRVAGAALESGIHLFAGAAGLATALAGLLPLPTDTARPTPVASSGPTLTFAGSRHTATARQIGHALGSGAAHVPLDDQALGGKIRRACAEIVAQISAGRSVIVSPDGTAAVESAALLRAFAAIARATVPGRALGGLILTGGDVAASICAALEVGSILVCGEALPAVPIGIICGGPASGLRLVTKAGSFGPPSTFTDLHHRFSTPTPDP